MKISPELLAEVGRQVLEEAAFVFADPAAAIASSPGGTVLEAALDFRAPERGRTRLIASEKIAEEISANMLGLEPGDPVARANARDALGEFLNILSGALVVSAFGPGALCVLGRPTVAELGWLPPRADGVHASLATACGDVIGLVLEPLGDGT